MKKLIAALVAGLALSGCMASMTAEQQESVEARMAEPTPRSVGPSFGPARDRDELIRHGEL